MSKGPVRHFHIPRGRPQIKLKADSCQKSNGSVIRGPLKGRAARSTYNNKQNFNKLKHNTMKQFAFIALFGAACALKTTALGGPDLQNGNPYKSDDPKAQEWDKCHKDGDKAACDMLGDSTKPKDDKKQGNKDNKKDEKEDKKKGKKTTDKKQPPKKDEGLDCSKSPTGDFKADIKALADKFTWGWISISDVPYITQFKGDENTDWNKVDWNAIDWEFNQKVEMAWADNFYNQQYDYVEYSVDADRFAGYLQDLASQMGRGDDQIWWLVGNMCTSLSAR